ncbi:MAG: hypothetical protein WDA18_09695 [Candidatus Ratteibacteria bacterium]
MFALLVLIGISATTRFIMKQAVNDVDRIILEKVVLPELLKEKEKGEEREE